MSSRFILNEFSYFGRGSRVELVPEIQKRGFKKVFVVTDEALVKCGVNWGKENRHHHKWWRIKA